jgi:hypothetical protein
MLCSKCGTENEDRSVCIKCGAFIAPKDSVRRYVSPEKRKKYRRRSFFKNTGNIILSVVLFLVGLLILSALATLIVHFLTRNMDFGPLPSDLFTDPSGTTAGNALGSLFYFLIGF